MSSAATEGLRGDPEETNEWIESFDELVAAGGQDRASAVLQALQARAGAAGVASARHRPSR